MLLYHGGRAISPKVKTQKELGIHCSPYTEEARYHFVTQMTRCNADVNYAIDCPDMGEWASLHAFTTILDCAGIADSANIAATVWRENDCRTNTVETSAVIRECLLDYDITCIHYVDSDDLKGFDCYILLEDQDFTAVRSIEEGWPNFAQANQLLSDNNQIVMFSNGRPHYSDGHMLVPVPHELYLSYPQDIANYINSKVSSSDRNRNISTEILERYVDLIQSDFNCSVKMMNRFARILIHNDSIISTVNPGISVIATRRRFSENIRDNILEIPASADVESGYISKVKPFIEKSI